MKENAVHSIEGICKRISFDLRVVKLSSIDSKSINHMAKISENLTTSKFKISVQNTATGHN